MSHGYNLRAAAGNFPPMLFIYFPLYFYVARSMVMNKAFTAAVASFYIKLLRVLGQKNLIINEVVNDGSKCRVTRRMH